MTGSSNPHQKQQMCKLGVPYPPVLLRKGKSSETDHVQGWDLGGAQISELLSDNTGALGAYLETQRGKVREEKEDIARWLKEI
jgi:hypothetical protein